MLKRDKFFNDPRVQEAKMLILSALNDAQAGFKGVEPAQPDCVEENAKAIQEFSAIRSLPLYYPYIGSGFGRGLLVELLDGSCKYDLICGIGVHYFGHSFHGIVEASLSAAISDTVMQGNLQQDVDSLDLVRRLVELSGFDHCFLSSSGAMACENALKICFQKKQPALRVLAFERCFAGRTLALSQLTDKPGFREGLPPTITVDYVPFFDAKNPIESTNRTLEALKKHLQRYPKQHAVMCMELVQGEGGFWTAPPGYFKAIIQLLKAHDVAVWVDEVQTFARTENLFAFQTYDLQGVVDVVTIGKVSPACATLFNQSMAPRPGLLSQTFTASTGAIHASKYIIDYAMSHHFFGEDGKIQTLFTAFTQGLVALHERYGCLHGPYGRGAMIAFTPFDGSDAIVKKFVQKLFDNGIISFVAGSNPTRVRFLLPIGVMEVDDIAPIMKIIEKTLQECMP